MHTYFLKETINSYLTIMHYETADGSKSLPVNVYHRTHSQKH